MNRQAVVVEFDAEMGAYRATHDWGDEVPVTVQVLSVVGEVANVDPTKLDTLHHRIDSEGLDDLFAPGKSRFGRDLGIVQFPIDHYWIALHANGDIWVFPHARRSRSPIGQGETENWNGGPEPFASGTAHTARDMLARLSRRLDRAREECDSDHLEEATSLVDRLGERIEDLEPRVPWGPVVTDVRPVRIEEIVAAVDAVIDDEALRIRIDPDVGTIVANPRSACILFETLFRRIIDHVDRDPTVRIGPLDDGFFIEGRGRGISDRIPGSVFDPGISTNGEGRGWERGIVEEIATVHAWTIAVADVEFGGVRFEFSNVERGEQNGDSAR